MEKEKEKKKISIKEIGPARLVILLLTGIFLLVLTFPTMFSQDKSSGNKKEDTNKSQIENPPHSETSNDADDYITDLENRLQKILGKVEGIGKVEVMITLKSSKERITLKDRPYTQESMKEMDGEGGSRESSSVEQEDSTVIVSSGSGESLPYVIKELEPEVAGVVVISEGGGNPVIKAEIMDAVQVLFNVPIHKIKVMKMNK